MGQIQHGMQGGHSRGLAWLPGNGHRNSSSTGPDQATQQWPSPRSWPSHPAMALWQWHVLDQLPGNSNTAPAQTCSKSPATLPSNSFIGLQNLAVWEEVATAPPLPNFPSHREPCGQMPWLHASHLACEPRIEHPWFRQIIPA